jgi:hypothetical protein
MANAALRQRDQAENAALVERTSEFQQEQAIRESQLAMQIARAPLENTLLQQHGELNALSIQSGLLANQRAIDGHSLLTDYAKVMQGANFLPLESGIRVHSQFGLNNPAILNTPEYKEAGKQLDERVKQASIEEYRLTLADAAQARAEALKAKTDYELKAKGDVLPRVIDIGGVPYMYNPGTKKSERLDKTESKSAFIEKRTLQYAKDNMIEPKAAAEQLGKLYDEQIAPLTAGASRGAAAAPAATAQPQARPAASAPAQRQPLKLGQTVWHNGKPYIYRGGPDSDPSSFVEKQ